MSDERKAFEAWRYTPLQALAKMYGPKQNQFAEELAWLAWQASRRVALEEAARFVEHDYQRQFDEPWRENVANAIRALVASPTGR